MDVAQRFEFNKRMNYSTTQAQLKAEKVDAILSNANSAKFVNPLTALGLAGTGLGALKGATSQDPYNQPIGTGERLKRIAVNAAAGGALGAGAGTLAKNFQPEILQAIDPAPVEGFKGIRNVLGSDLGDEAATIAANNRRQAAKLAKEAADREAVQAARQLQRQQLQQATSSRLQNIQQRYAGAVDDIAASQAKTRENIQAGLQNIAGTGQIVAQKVRPITDKVGNAVEAVEPKVRDLYQASAQGNGLLAPLDRAVSPKVKPVFDRIWDKGRRDIETTRQFLNARNPGFSANHLQAAKFGLFDTVPDTVSKPLIAGVGLGLGTGATLGAANAIQQNQRRNNNAFNNIYAIPDPNQRVQAFDSYTSNPDAGMRTLGDTSNILGKTALGAGAGALGGGLLLGGAEHIARKYK